MRDTKPRRLLVDHTGILWKSPSKHKGERALHLQMCSFTRGSAFSETPGLHVSGFRNSLSRKQQVGAQSGWPVVSRLLLKFPRTSTCLPLLGMWVPCEINRLFARGTDVSWIIGLAKSERSPWNGCLRVCVDTFLVVAFN